MPAMKDITGNKYNSLLVIERAENINGRVAWKCLCDCGETTIIRTGDLTPGRVKSCGKCKESPVLYEFKKNYVVGHCESGRSFIIDDEDLFKIRDFYVNVSSKGYVSLSKNGTTVSLHRYLLQAPKNKVVDHINRNPSDNRKLNLRLCSIAENSWNKNIYKNNKSGMNGVSRKRDKWRAYIQINRKCISLGCYKTKEEAIAARKQAEIKYFGEFSPNYRNNSL